MGANFGVAAADLSDNLGEESYVLSDPYKNASFLPFGAGLRACFGQRFYVLGIASIFASLIEHYQVYILTDALGMVLLSSDS